MALIEIKLKRVSKIYNPGDLISGIVTIICDSEFSHQGINLTMKGNVNKQISAKTNGVFDAFYKSIKPMNILQVSSEICPPGRLPSGATEIPFEYPLKNNEDVLYETFHGVYINIQYLMEVEVKRSLLNKDLLKQCEFIIENKRNQKPRINKQSSIQFTITPESIQAKDRKTNQMARFKITGELNNSECPISEPITGQITVEDSVEPLKSVELQLMRVETCGCSEGYATDATEIQNIQVIDGNVCRKLEIPLLMVLPRLFTCVTLATTNFKIEFELNLVIQFENGQIVIKNFPIQLVR